MLAVGGEAVAAVGLDRSADLGRLLQRRRRQADPVPDALLAEIGTLDHRAGCRRTGLPSASARVRSDACASASRRLRRQLDIGGSSAARAGDGRLGRGDRRRPAGSSGRPAADRASDVG